MIRRAREARRACSFLLALGLMGLAAPGSQTATGAGTDAGAGVDLATLWKAACQWEVGANQSSVPAARQALIAQGSRTLAFLVPAKLDTRDTLITRALEVVLTGIGQIAVPPLVQALDGPAPDVRANAASLLGALGAVTASPAITRLLADRATQLGALAALSRLRSQASVPAIIAVMQSGAPERVRCQAAVALGEIGGEPAISSLIASLAARPAPLRFAAQYALEKLRAVPALRQQLTSGEPTARLHAISALGHIGEAAAREDLLTLLEDASPIVRGFATEALTSMLDDATRSRLAKRRTLETDAFVLGKLAAASRPGAP